MPVYIIKTDKGSFFEIASNKARAIRKLKKRMSKAKIISVRKGNP